MRRSALIIAAGWAFAGAMAPQARAETADPTSVPAPTFQEGDTWTFEQTHEVGKTGFTQQRVVQRVDRVSSENLVLGEKLEGAQTDFEDHLMGLDLSGRRVIDGKSTVTERALSFPLRIGATWQEDYTDPRQQGNQTSAHVHRDYKVIGWQDVKTPAGVFHSLKIEANGTLEAHLSLPATATTGGIASTYGATSVAHAERARNVVVTHTTYREIYYSPAVRCWVKIANEQYDPEGVRIKRDTVVLADFTPAS